MSKITLITRDNCVYCVAAKQRLQDRGLEFTEQYIGRDIQREEVLENYPTQKLLPVVLIDDKLIGGFEELDDWLNPPLEIDNESQG